MNSEHVWYSSPHCTHLTGTKLPIFEHFHVFQLAAALFADDDDEDNENSFSIRKIKNETGFGGDDGGGGRISPASTIMSEVSKLETAHAGSAPGTRAPTPTYDPEIQPPFQPGIN